MEKMKATIMMGLGSVFNFMVIYLCFGFKGVCGLIIGTFLQVFLFKCVRENN